MGEINQDWTSTDLIINSIFTLKHKPSDLELECLLNLNSQERWGNKWSKQIKCKDLWKLMIVDSRVLWLCPNNS